MKLQYSALVPLAVLCFSSGAASAQPTISFETKAVIASGVSAGAEVAWVMAGRELAGYTSYVLSGARLVTDDDRDGTVRVEPAWDVPVHSVWAAVDLTSGTLSIAAPAGHTIEELPFPGQALGQGLGGRLNRFQKQGRMLQVLLARKGVGAWTLQLGDGGRHDADGENDGSLQFDLDAMESLGSGAPPPEEFAPEDVVVLIDPETLQVFAATLGAHPGQGGN